jgi:hypothetical protein
LQRAKDTLARYENIADAEYEALDSFRRNNYRPASDRVADANLRLNEKELERYVATARCDVANQKLEVLRLSDAQESQVANAKR